MSRRETSSFFNLSNLHILRPNPNPVPPLPLFFTAFDAGEIVVASSHTRCQEPPKTLVDWALEILSIADPDDKAPLENLVASQWLRGNIPLPYDPSCPARPPPDCSARSVEVRLLPPSRMPKLGKGSSAQSRLVMLHSQAHTESWAIDLSWDIVARFGAAMRMACPPLNILATAAQ